MSTNNLIGRVVLAKTGRDAGKFFVIVGIIDNNYVYIANGKNRKIEKPKLKKLKHLNFTNVSAEEVISSLLRKEPITNANINKIIKSVEIIKEV